MNVVAVESGESVEAQPDVQRVHRAGGYVLAGLAGALVGGLVVAVATRALPTLMSKAMRKMMAGMAASSGGPCGNG